MPHRLLCRLLFIGCCVVLCNGNLPARAAETAAAEPAAAALPPSVLPISDCPSLPTETDPQLLAYLDTRSAGGGRWSADNAEIAFTTNWTGTYQKWRMPADSGYPQQITYFTDPVSSCDFSPTDPELMLCAVASGGNERDQLYLINRDGSDLRPLAVDPKVWHRIGGWSRDGRYVSFLQNNRDERYFDLWLADLQTGEQRLLWAPDKNLSGGPFSPDGRWLLCDDSPSNFDNYRYLVDTTTGAATLLTPHTEPAVYNIFRWADDHTLYCVSNQQREFQGLARLDIHHPGELTWVHTPAADIQTMQVSPDGRYIGWSENRDGFVEVHLATLPDLAPLPAPELPPGIQNCSDFSWDSRYELLQATAPNMTGDIYRYEFATGATKRLSFSGTGGIDPRNFVTPEIVRIESFDGLKISGLWFTPAGAKPAAGWPTIVLAHGGPEGQSQPWFDSQVQLYLSKGFAVLEPNPRGSTGFGRTFEHLDDVGKRLDSVHDYVAFRDWLVEQGLADPQRLAITGGSYGGYVVLAALTFYPAKFTCGVCLFGIANFVTFLENTAPYRRPVREAEYGSLATDHDLLVQISPLSRIADVTAPLLIMQGANDPRVPLSESTQMYDALKAAGREVQLLAFSNEGHGFTKRENRLLSWGTELNFLQQHIGAAK